MVFISFSKKSETQRNIKSLTYKADLLYQDARHLTTYSLKNDCLNN